MSIEQVTTLSQLAERANEEHLACESALQTGLQHAINAGQSLIEAKALCAHGQWLPWLQENFHGSERTAQAYMRVARHYALGEGESANPQRVADLSYREALRELSEPAQPAVSETVDNINGSGDLVDNVNEVSEIKIDNIQLDPPAESAWQRHIKDVTGFTPCESPEEFLDFNRPYLDEEPADPYRFWWDNHLVRIATVFWFRHDSTACANCRDAEMQGLNWPCMPLPSSVLATRENLSRLGTAVAWRAGDFANWAFDHDVMYETGKGKNRAVRMRRVSPERFAACTCEWCEERRAEAPDRAHEVHIAAVGYAFRETGAVLLPEPVAEGEAA